ncbi:MAG TPA: hypothetical protein VFO15_19250, partial [Xanthobacteraceae bacterium]|nr:hypothetical protein [Xanthobacteraceae bacterium]
CCIRNIGILGDPFSVADNPHTQENTIPGRVGILIQQAILVNMQSVEVSGAFQDAGIKFEQPAPGAGIPFDKCLFSAVNVILNMSQLYPGQSYPNARAWKGLEFVDRNRVTFIQCNNP